VPEEKPQRRTGLVIGGAVAAVAVVAIVATALGVVFTRESKPSDEEQIRQVIASMVDAWNNSDFEKYRQAVCEKNQKDSYFSEEFFLYMTDSRGPIHITVKSVEVKGDTAIAVIDVKLRDAEQTDEDEYVRENGEWKQCSTNK